MIGDCDYDHESMRLNRKMFLSGETCDQQTIRPRIMESWIRSKNYGLNPLRVVPPASNHSDMQKIEDKWIFRRETNIDNVRKLYARLENDCSVLIFLDNDLNVWLLRGSTECIQMLQSLSIGIGSNLKEEYFGTNAAAMTHFKKNTQYVLGAEHYLEVLQGFASIACERRDEFSEEVSGYLMFLLPLHKFTPYAIISLDYFAQLNRTTVRNHWSKTALHMTQDFFYSELQQKEEGVIFVDSKGYIITSNSWVLEQLGIKHQEIRGSSLKDTFPEFKLDRCLTSGKSINLHHVFLREPINKSVYVKCRAVTNEGSIIGMVITIFESKIVQRLVNRVSNNSAYFIFEDLIGCSPCFQTSKEIAKTAAESSSNVLIVGESGTGKELFAQAIHNGGSRHSHPFISINCAAIPRELIGSELFGYVEGAFTGARKSGAPGKFEIADKGTIFLDEIGEMPLDMQAVLLRVLEEKRVTRLGGSISAPIDVRVIAATNKNLWELVKTNAFRMDLFYRLNVLRLEIPPLRERKDDIPLLIEHFIKQFNASLHKNITDYEPEAKNFLQQYTWPGNIRELRNIVERCVNLSKSSMLTIHDLPRELLPSATENKSETPPATDPYEKKLASKFTLEMNEKLKIADLLRQYNYNKSRVAHELGISRVTLYKKLKEMGL